MRCAVCPSDCFCPVYQFILQLSSLTPQHQATSQLFFLGSSASDSRNNTANARSNAANTRSNAADSRSNIANARDRQGFSTQLHSLFPVVGTEGISLPSLQESCITSGTPDAHFPGEGVPCLSLREQEKHSKEKGCFPHADSAFPLLLAAGAVRAWYSYAPVQPPTLHIPAGGDALGQ